MRRIIIGFMMMALILVGSSFADEFVFSFRNGISFDDDKETVLSKEPDLEQDGSNPDVLFKDMTLSGIKDSQLAFHFEYNRLIGIELMYKTSSEFDVNQKDYDAIKEGLVRKYGQPVADIENAISYPGGAIEKMNHWGEGSEGLYLDKTVYGINQWIIEVDEDYKIVIEHVFFGYIYKGNQYSDPQQAFRHRVSYQYLRKNALPTDIIDKDL